MSRSILTCLATLTGCGASGVAGPLFDCEGVWSADGEARRRWTTTSLDPIAVAFDLEVDPRLDTAVMEELGPIEAVLEPSTVTRVARFTSGTDVAAPCADPSLLRAETQLGVRQQDHEVDASATLWQTTGDTPQLAWRLEIEQPPGLATPPAERVVLQLEGGDAPETWSLTAYDPGHTRALGGGGLVAHTP